MAEKGKVVWEELACGWELRPLARMLGVSKTALQKWLKAAGGVEDDLDRGRPSELLPSHKVVLTRLASNPATAHLPAKVLWQYYLQEFECSPECQASHDCPHKTVSYYTALRFLQSLPSAYREGKLRLRKRFRASHTSLVPPGMVWLADRSKSDIELMQDE
jgi:predicted transcriptional regulator